jgi:cytochrome c biogenesis protein CcdA
MEGFLALGFLIGMQHALEADHLAAVGAMASGRPSSRRALVLRGAAWGLGHSMTLFAICSVVILLGLTLTDRVSAALEFGVGVMLVLLGIDVLARFRRKRVHFHLHRHDDGQPHLHAHSHAGEGEHRRSPHEHRHPDGLPWRALAIGLVHGAAGSAGLLVLAVAATQDPLVAILYIAVFGLGSILGMAALSFVAAWPLGLAANRACWLHTAFSIGAGFLAIGLGIDVMFETGALAWSVF